MRYLQVYYMFIKQAPHWLRKVEAPSQTYFITNIQVSVTFEKSLNPIMATMQRIMRY